MSGPDETKSLALMVDLYELTMAASYFDHGLNGQSTFSLFIRQYPPHRSYFVAMGLADLVDYLESFRFLPSDIDYLHSLNLFSDDFLDYLQGIRFSGRLPSSTSAPGNGRPRIWLIAIGGNSATSSGRSSLALTKRSSLRREPRRVMTWARSLMAFGSIWTPSLGPEDSA